jgi:thiol:disulfide interchange protein DsbD
VVTLSGAAEPATAVPGGTVALLWRLRIAEGWHLYGNGRNDSGFAPRVQLTLPPGWTAGPLLWPAPARHVSAGDILDHIYEGELVLLQEVSIPADAATGSRASLRARWEWLACRESCVPGLDSLVVGIAVDPAAPAMAPSPALAAAREKLPQPLPDGLVTRKWEGLTLRIERVSPASGRLTFMPDLDCAELVDLLHDGVGESLALRVATPTGAAQGRAASVRGLLLVEGTSGQARAYTIDVPVDNRGGSDAGAPPNGG